MVNLLSAERLSKSLRDAWLFRDVSLGIAEGEKYGLVGVNGVGKSTLLRILAGRLAPDEGAVVVRQGVRVGILDQNPAVADDLALRDLLFDEENEVGRVVKDYEEAVVREASGEEMQHLLQRMEELQAWSYESNVKEVVGKLGVPDLDTIYGNLSGGQKKRVHLAKVLISQPDLLILDEPTNHLDVDAIEWLEDYLSAAKVTFIMVTHDRYFLDKVATGILELDGGRLYSHSGNYAEFLTRKAEREEIKKAEAARARNLLRKELEWMRRQPKARGTKSRARIAAIETLKEKASGVPERREIKLEMNESRQGGKILELEHVRKAYGDKVIIRDFSYVFKKGDRIGVIGRNGAGKSTLLDVITRRSAPDKGMVVSGLTTRIGYFSQQTAELNPAIRVIEEVRSIAEFITLRDGTSLSASRFLEQFNFPPEKQYTPIARLSGGEKKRLQLLKLLMGSPNFLVLDEPTNDFDIDTLNALGDFLENFAGCLVLVSHDRYFMDQLVDQLFVVADGEVSVFNGNYSDYRAWKTEQAKPVEMPDKPIRSRPEVPSSSPRKLSYKEKKELEQLTIEIEALEREKATVVELLSGGETDHRALLDLSNKIRTLDQAIENLTERWLVLSEREE
ncbi:MAG TPA: ABC-F family ATP-binding cassette domain-containing protein [Cyclobacteriaceae bacterium]